MFVQLLVPLDGSERSAQVIPHLKWLGPAVSGTVELLTVVPGRMEIVRDVGLQIDSDDVSGALAYYPSEEVIERIETRAREAARAAAEREASSLADAGIQAQVRVVSGDPAEQILLAAEQRAESLVAMTTHGRSGVQRWLLGSVTDKVVRHSTRPVLVVRVAEDDVASAAAVQGLVVPLDGSELAEGALEPAATIARELALPVQLIRSVSLKGVGYGFVEDGPLEYADLVGRADQIARDYLNEVAKRLRGKGVKNVRTEVADKSPDDAILDAVGPQGANLVVMTSHGRSGINRWVLGSVADRVVRHSPGPVLLVPSRGT